MSALNSLTRLFKPAGAGAADAVQNPDGFAMAQNQTTTDEFAASMIADGVAAAKSTDSKSLSIPLLGTRSAGAHQRILAVLGSLALLVLGAVAFYAVTQADKVAQGVTATGTSLMQSQRLAKSVSQALVGSAQAFPDVRESADVLAKNVRGLKAGDASIPTHCRGVFHPGSARLRLLRAGVADGPRTHPQRAGTTRRASGPT